MEVSLQEALHRLSCDFSLETKEIYLRMDGIQNDMCSKTSEKMKITGRSTIEEALSSHPTAHLVMAEVQLQSCQNCAVRFDETLFEAAEFYEFSLEYVLLRLNGLEQ